MDAKASVFWVDPSNDLPWWANLQLQNATAALYNVPTYRIQVGEPGDIKLIQDQTPDQEPEEVWTRTVNRLFAHSSTGSLRIFSDSGSALEPNLNLSQVHLSAPNLAPEMHQDSAFQFLHQLNHQALRPSGVYASLSTPHWPELVFNGDHVAFLAGDSVLLDGKPVTTGTFLNTQKSTIDPLTGTGRYVYDNLLLMLQFDSAKVAVGPGSAWVFESTQQRGMIQGEATWRNVNVAVDAGGEPLPQQQHILTLQGGIQFESRLQDGRTVWAIEGEATGIFVDTVALIEGAVLGVTTLGVLAAILLLTEVGRGLLTALIGRSTPKLVKADAYASATRRRIMQEIHARQPIRQHDLVHALGLAKSTVAYHLRILMAHDILQAASSGDRRGHAYMLNSGSLMFKMDGLASISNKCESKVQLTPGRVLAVANGNPIRRRVFETILAHGPLSFAEIVQKFKEQGTPLTRSTGNRHLLQLERIHAIRSHWVAGCKIYQPNLDLRNVKSEQYRLYFEMNGLTKLMAALSKHGSCSPDQLAQMLHVGPRQIRSTLHQLKGIGVVDEHSGNQFSIAPALAGWQRGASLNV